MGTALQQTDYQCDQCGATNIVAAPVVFPKEPTVFRADSVSSGTTQSFAARGCTATSRGYVRPFLCWGSLHLLSSFLDHCWALVQFSSTRPSAALGHKRLPFPLYWTVLTSLRWFLSFQAKVALYNRTSLSSTLLGLGTHICVQAVRSIQIDSVIAKSRLASDSAPEGADHSRALTRPQV